MSDEDKELTSTISVGTAKHTMATGPNGKGAVAVPKLSDDDHVEMEEILASGTPANPDEDIMQLARLGDVQGMEKLLDSGKFEGTYADAEGITPLHVCAVLGSSFAFTDPFFLVGGYKQPICHVPVSPQSWRGCQQEGGRISCYAGYVGCSKVSLLHGSSATRARRRPAPHGCSRLQYPPSRNL